MFKDHGSAHPKRPLRISGGTSRRIALGGFPLASPKREPLSTGNWSLGVVGPIRQAPSAAFVKMKEACFRDGMSWSPGQHVKCCKLGYKYKPRAIGLDDFLLSYLIHMGIADTLFGILQGNQPFWGSRF